MAQDMDDFTFRKRRLIGNAKGKVMTSISSTLRQSFVLVQNQSSEKFEMVGHSVRDLIRHLFT